MRKKPIIILLVIYFTLRIFSYFFQPSTTLHGSNLVNTIVSALILLTVVCCIWKNDERGWLAVAGELILGGAGGFLAIEGVSLRTTLLFASLSIYFLNIIRNKGYKIFSKSKAVSCLLSFIFIIALFASVRGYLSGHAPRLIISDIIPYFYFLYYFPLRDLFQSERFRQFARNAIIAAVIGNAIFIFLTLTGFSSGIFQMQDGYYHWYRDIALGKITDVGYNFYRLVLDEHLLLTPLILLLLSQLVYSKNPSLFGREPVKSGEKTMEPPARNAGGWNHLPAMQAGGTKENPNNGKISVLIGALLFILSINLTRIYMVALAVGLLFIFSKQYWKRWLLCSVTTLIFLFASFTAIHLAVSRGQSLGWEIFGIRLQSVVAPNIEESSMSRMILLPKIWEKIKTNPIIGTGLGDTVTAYSPIFKKEITTPHFDWGYLEMTAELGLIGLMVWLLLIGYIFKNIISNIKYLINKKIGIYAGAAPLVSLLVINITSPALFHVMGVSLLTIFLICAILLHSCSLQNKAKIGI